MRLPSGCRKRARVARRGLGRLPRRTAASAGTSLPDKRTIPMPPIPGGVAAATMVSAEEFIAEEFMR
jgi:hypothetical protein